MAVMGATDRAVCGEPAGQVLGMVVDFILGCSIGEDAYIGIEAVGEDSYLLVFECRGEKIGGPEDGGFAGSPCVVRVAVQPMNKDNTACERAC